MQHDVRMASRMSEPVVRRPSLPLAAVDEAELALLRESETHRRALALLAPTGPSPVEQVTEAVLLHAIFEAGLAAVRAQAEDEGYRQLAADAEPQSARRRMSRRRRPAWADEA